ncbi:methylated-DNA--[protein]-cysteine S-methyltransferase [Pseudokordiimonas caeni]|uniref:methylated-DNA--[protein]-cysteine S-methyltransferase n=1 Tax=Pseudokordiimonas caeni TaxID=2997908 RepID=UPI0028112FC7|nr:methylated-DNA--[protein]-cysteine S-methyltransferase [Pseudokordiimonas caeni]
MPQLSMHTPISDLTIHEWDGALVALDWGWGGEDEPTPLLREAKRQLDAYFDGDLTRFDLPFAPEGTPFQKRLWRALSDIPYGETRSYGELATALTSSARAVGTACGRNPLPILIPCHRVLAAGGNMGGYSGDGGLMTKKALLVLEGAMSVEQGLMLEALGFLD